MMIGRRVQVPAASYSCLTLFFMTIVAMASMSSASLEVGFYRGTCPLVETIVQQIVRQFVAKDPGFAAGLIRMYFHDCFVRGCDASVLLDSTPGKPSEKESPANKLSLRGVEVIEAVKAAVEGHCPRTVSCADIIAFAARDSAYLAGGIDYPVPAGRRDGRISVEAEVLQNLPFPHFSADQLKDNFARKGLSIHEMVALSGAHSMGRSHCSSFAERLYMYNFSATGHPLQDPSMDPAFAAYLKVKCPPSTAHFGDPTTVPLACGAAAAIMPNALTNHYYKNLRNHRGLLTSDQTLHTSAATEKLVRKNAKHRNAWSAKFAAAMVHMGSIDVLTGSQGEIRERCKVVN